MKIRPFFVFALVLGVLWGCEAPSPLIRNAQVALQINNFEAALQYAEQALEEDSTNALAHYYRGYALAGIAEEVQPPSDRKPYYEEMRKSMDTAKRLSAQMDRVPGELENIDDLIVSVWANEHNSGAEIMTSDSVRRATQNPQAAALAHLENAITVEPDSSITYAVLSTLQYQLGNMDEATEVYKLGMSKMETPKFEDYEYLISLYFIQDRFAEARDLAMEAIEDYPEESVFAQFLADAYMEMGETDEAVRILRQLISSQPDNPQFYFVLGTQLYRTAQQTLNEASSRYEQAYQIESRVDQVRGAEQQQLRQQIETLRAEAETLEAEGEQQSEEAVREILNSLRLEPNDDNAYNVLGIIYQNRAAALFDKRNNTRDNALALEYDGQARDNLRRSMEYYEKAAELNPGEKEYWQSLFQVYTTLGMDEQAQEAMRRAE